MQKTKQKDTGPVLFLSLFLLLLAFFILLNSLMTIEETKSQAVISSVVATFKTTEKSNISAQILISTLGPVPEPEEILSEVERLWVTAIPLTKRQTITPGREMEMRMQAKDLFVRGDPGLRADRQSLIHVTADALSARIEGFTAVMYFVMGTEDFDTARSSMNVKPKKVEVIDPATLPPVNMDDPVESFLTLDPARAGEDKDLSFARVTNFAQKLVAAGGPPTGISVGLKEGNPDEIRIRFSIFPNDEAYNSFSDLVAP